MNVFGTAWGDATPPDTFAAIVHCLMRDLYLTLNLELLNAAQLSGALWCSKISLIVWSVRADNLGEAICLSW
ncbi:hypothetical protein HZU72_16905 [Halomonas sp. QX-2]|jgi:hypothetical protein|uniref:Uncharacterized protein n=1 Tax=Vreelandella sedimenti TaxID=2729618 RepID=A0A7Z0SR17_9GAMM|nr:MULTISPECIES: hypothetical protein [Halomonas]NYT74094.1 hypothetical protein [Halomonas sedimenti]|tara:strand:- start:40573 stop:40788 length:216 start_codon:yes stop_codon:yes gene_type:complete